jgi:hypothetical protein
MARIVFPGFCYLSLGPIDEVSPTERKFKPGDTVIVTLEDIPGKPDAMNLYFSDGEFAEEVPCEFFEILSDRPVG